MGRADDDDDDDDDDDGGGGGGDKNNSNKFGLGPLACSDSEFDFRNLRIYFLDIW